MTGIWRLRAAVLTLVGVVGVHQGRYLFATAEHEHELARAHTYLSWLTHAAAALLFLAVVQLAVRLGRPRHERAPRLPSTRTLWLAATATLLVVFVAQESLESVFAHGRLPGLAELLADGGWTAALFASAAGGLSALLLRGAASAVRRALERHMSQARRAAGVVLAPSVLLLCPPASVLARRLAGRAPPFALS